MTHPFSWLTDVGVPLGFVLAVTGFFHAWTQLNRHRALQRHLRDEQQTPENS